jgi:predicted nucleotidyltransferase
MCNDGCAGNASYSRSDPRMIAMEIIREMAGKIVEAFHPERIILFGSHARGTAREHSDVDLLVVTHDTRPKPMRSVPIYRLLRDYPYSKDILVFTPEEIEDYRELKPSLIYRAYKEGIVLYERPA